MIVLKIYVRREITGYRGNIWTINYPLCWQTCGIQHDSVMHLIPYTNFSLHHSVNTLMDSLNLQIQILVLFFFNTYKNATWYNINLRARLKISERVSEILKHFAVSKKWYCQHTWTECLWLANEWMDNEAVNLHVIFLIFAYESPLSSKFLPPSLIASRVRIVVGYLEFPSSEAASSRVCKWKLKHLSRVLYLSFNFLPPRRWCTVAEERFVR